MHLTLRYFAIPAIILLFSPAYAQVQPGEFLGMRVPGRLMDAKVGGFTDCSASHYAFVCKREVDTLVYGVRANRVEISIDGKEYFTETYKTSKYEGKDVRSLPPDVLAYGSITLHFNKSQYDYKCEEKLRAPGHYSHLTQCITNKDTIDQLDNSLEANGWIQHNLRDRYKSYVKSGESVAITTQQEYATVRRITPSERDRILESVSQRKATEASMKSSADLVIQQMRTK